MDYASRHGLLQDCVVAIHNAQWPAVADRCTKDLPSCGCFPDMLAGDAETQVNGSAQPDELALAVSRPPPKDTASANGGVLLSVSTVPNGTGPTVGTTSHNGHSGSTHHDGCLSKGCAAKVEHTEPSLPAQHVPSRSSSQTPSDLVQCAPFAA